MKRRLTGAAVTMLVAGLVAGCGGGGDDGPAGGGADAASTADGALTKAEFISRADAICRATVLKVSKAALKLRESATKNGNLPVAEVASFLETTSLPAYDAMLNKLRDLTPPTADQKVIDDYIASLAGAIDVVKPNPEKYSRNNSPDPFNVANAKAGKYGMKVCGS